MALKLKQLSTQRPDLADLSRAMSEMERDHPRSAAVVGAAFLEDTLTLAITTKIIDLSKDDSDRLFIGSGPFSSFSVKTLICFALGLIGPKARHDLDTIREIRNAFAHAKISIDFDSEPVANAIEGLHFKSLIASWEQMSNQRRFATAVNVLMIYVIGIGLHTSTSLFVYLEVLTHQAK